MILFFAAEFLIKTFGEGSEVMDKLRKREVGEGLMGIWG